MASRPIQPEDIAMAAMGGAAVKKLEVKRMPKVRPDMCAGCPFRTDVNVFIALQCKVLKDQLTTHPNAVWMCHETSSGGAQPTAKSIICKGAADWRETEKGEDNGNED